MVALIIIAALAFMIIQFIVHDAASKKIIYLFFFYWSFNLYMASIGALELYKPSSTAVIILSIGAFSLILGFSTIRIRKNERSQLDFDNLTRGCDLVTENTYFKILTWILLLYSFYLFTIYIFSLGSGMNLSDIRGAYYESNLYGPGYEMINLYIITPYVLFTRPLFGFQIVFHRNKDCIPLGLILVINALLGGGRFSFVYMALPIVCALFFYKEIRGSGIKLKFKQYVLIGMAVVGFFFLIIFLSGGRRTNFGSADFYEVALESGYKDVAKYSIGPTVAFDYAINHQYVEQMGGYQYGALSLSSLETIPFWIALRIGAGYERPLFKLSSIIQEQQIEIGYNQRWNALYTWCLYFYLDFGVFGVVLFPFLFGRLLRISIKRFYHRGNIESFALVGIFFFITIMSPIAYMLQSMTAAFLIIYLFCKKEK